MLQLLEMMKFYKKEVIKKKNKNKENLVFQILTMNKAFPRKGIYQITSIKQKKQRQTKNSKITLIVYSSKLLLKHSLKLLIIALRIQMNLTIIIIFRTHTVQSIPLLPLLQARLQPIVPSTGTKCWDYSSYSQVFC